MENHRRCLLDELSRAQEMLRQLQAHLDQPSASLLCKTLAQEILSCIEKAVSLAKPSTTLEDQQKISDQQGPKEQAERRDFYKRSRKTLPAWTKLVRLGGGQASEEGSLNDGYQWRKYGEKEILGAKHRRGYYRCTHRNTLGCKATKQVQKTDEDPSILQVAYYGVHTCNETNHEVMETAGMKREDEEEEEDHDNQQLLNFQTYATSAIKPKDETASSSSSFFFNHTLMGSSISSTNFAKTSSQLNPELGENISPDAMLEMNFIMDPNFLFDDTPKFF